jgi:hypothetical protein
MNEPRGVTMARKRNGQRWRKSYATLEEAAEAARLKRLELFTHNVTDREELNDK